MVGYTKNACKNKGSCSLLIDNKLRLAITDSCNLSCFYCHNEGQHFYAKSNSLELPWIQSMADWFLKNNIYIESVNLTGGEPLLHKHLIPIIDTVSQITSEVRINTNAVLLNEELIDTFVEHGVYALKIGIDSLFAKQTKPNIIQTHIDVENVLAMIKYASKRMRVVLNTVVTQFNYDQIDTIIDFAKNASIPRLKVIRLHDFDSRGLNGRADVSTEFKTNQYERDWFYFYLEKYCACAKKIIYNKEKGRTDVFLSDDFEIRFCNDLCYSGACGNMFTAINANGQLIICPKKKKVIPISFEESDEKIISAFRYVSEQMCNSAKNHYSKYCDTDKLFIEEQYPDNFRTLAGFRTPHGITSGTIARSARPMYLTTSKLKELLDNGFQTVIDLRRNDEVQKKKSGYNNDVLNYYNLPMLNEPYRIKSEEPQRGYEYYNRILSEKENVYKILECIAKSEGGIIYHCAGGKSRSGVLTALLLMLVDVSIEDIAQDYCQTYLQLYGRETYEAKVGAGTRDITVFCECLLDNFSSAENYLRYIGLSEENTQNIKRKLLSE